MENNSWVHEKNDSIHIENAKQDKVSMSEDSRFVGHAIHDVERHTSGVLYLVPTPIGNMEDMTYRAVRVLREVDMIAAEDTRHTGILLSYYDIHKPLISYHEHNKDEKGAYLISLLQAGNSIAQVSDAGMPAISDPGADLVKKAIAAGISIVPLPGANAALTSLIASGLSTKQFTFFGFLPKRKSNRKEMLSRIRSQEGTLLFYEAPHRLRDVLLDMHEQLGNRPIVIAREVTKKFETMIRTDLSSLVADDSQIMYKGEFVVVLGGAETSLNAAANDDTMEDIPYEEAVYSLIQSGIAKKEAIRIVAKKRHVSRRDVYNAVEAASEQGGF